MSKQKDFVGVIVHPVRMELFKLYEQMGKPQLTMAVLAEMRDRLFPLDLFKEVFEYRDKMCRLKEICDKNNATCENRRICFGTGKSGFYVSFSPIFSVCQSKYIGTTIDEAIAWMEKYDKSENKDAFQ